MRTRCGSVVVVALACLIAIGGGLPQRQSKESALAEDGEAIHFNAGHSAYGPPLHISSPVLQLAEPSLKSGQEVWLPVPESHHDEAEAHLLLELPLAEHEHEHGSHVSDNIDTKLLMSYG